MRRCRELLCAALLLGVICLQAAPMVQVVGLFPGAAVLKVDGERKLVRVGQSGPGGVQVLSAAIGLRAVSISLPRRVSSSAGCPFKISARLPSTTPSGSLPIWEYSAAKCPLTNTNLEAPPPLRGRSDRRSGWGVLAPPVGCSGEG